MTGHTHSLAEWSAFLSLGVGGWASCAALLYLICDADWADFDPRPAVRRTVAAAHQAAVHVGHDLNWAYASCLHTVRDASAYARLAARDAALTVAALLALLTLEHAR